MHGRAAVFQEELGALTMAARARHVQRSGSSRVGDLHLMRRRGEKAAHRGHVAPCARAVHVTVVPEQHEVVRWLTHRREKERTQPFHLGEGMRGYL